MLPLRRVLLQAGRRDVRDVVLRCGIRPNNREHWQQVSSKGGSGEARAASFVCSLARMPTDDPDRPRLGDSDTEPRSFSWTEEFDESLNFWFWLRRTGGIDEARLLERLNDWADEGSVSLQQHNKASFDRHQQVRDHERWREYLPVGQLWRKTQVQQHTEEIRAQKPAHARAYYKSMEALGVRLRVQWVMAPFRQRWLLPPDLAVMGVEGATAESRRQAVLAAARALASSSAAS
jgi:hypothetical protein